MRIIVALLFMVALAGCVDTVPTYHISGAFTPDRSDADIQALIDHAAGLGANAAIMESFPEQFTVRGFELDACEDMAAWLAAQDFIASVTSCQRDVMPA